VKPPNTDSGNVQAAMAAMAAAKGHQAKRGREGDAEREAGVAGRRRWPTCVGQEQCPVQQLWMMPSPGAQGDAAAGA